MQIEAKDTDLYTGFIDMDSVDWAAVARAYKLIRLCPLENANGQEKMPEDLQAKYLDWFTSSAGRPEFEIALRMVFEESMLSDEYLLAVQQLFGGKAIDAVTRVPPKPKSTDDTTDLPEDSILSASHA